MSIILRFKFFPILIFLIISSDCLSQKNKRQIQENKNSINEIKGQIGVLSEKSTTESSLFNKRYDTIQILLQNQKQELAQLGSDIDSVRRQIVNYGELIKILDEKIDSVSKRSLMESSNVDINAKLMSERLELINKYIRGKNYRLLYYHSYDGVGPDGGSFTSIANINGSYYLGDISNGGAQKISRHTEQSYIINKFSLSVDKNLRFIIVIGDDIKSGYISISHGIWGNDPNMFPDSVSSKVLIKNNDVTYLPIIIQEFSTIRGDWDFNIYLHVGKVKYSFGKKEYEITNPIIFQSTHVEYIFYSIN
ncbi:MAG: hypothetical protein ACKO6Q_07440 [Bacteroidota bacterium]